MAKDLYRILGIAPDASPAEIRRAHRRLVKGSHPDCSDQPVERFHDVREAYEVLSDPEARACYDRGRQPAAAGPAHASPASPRQGPERPSRPPRREVVVEVVLTPGEARRGIVVPLELPVRRPCPACRGAGGVGRSPCRRCAGRGAVVRRVQLELTVPPGVAPGTIRRLGLDAHGHAGVDLVVVLSIDPFAVAAGWWW
jgi:DnaJ-class molecular chaperone